MNGLLSCPFCGGEAVHYTTGIKGYNEQWVIFCKKCGARTVEIGSLSEAIAAWNKRANGWVPARERLPDIENPHRIIVSDGNDSLMSHTNWLYRNPEGVLRSPGRYGNGIDVRWWMLWPEPPK